MGLSASYGGVADLKLDLWCGDLELHLFLLSGSDIGLSLDLVPLWRRSSSISINRYGWFIKCCLWWCGWGDLIFDACFLNVLNNISFSHLPS